MFKFAPQSNSSMSYSRPSGPYNAPPGTTRPPRNVEDIVTRLPPLTDSSKLPSLPSPPREPLVFHGKYTVSTHLVPAAYPRHPSSAHLLHPKVSPPIPSQPSPEQATTKERRQAWAKHTSQLLTQKRAILQEVEYELEDSSFEFDTLDDPVLWNAINRYARIENVEDNQSDTALTLIVTCANGYPKEVGSTHIEFRPLDEREILFCVDLGTSVATHDFPMRTPSLGDSASRDLGN